MRLAGIQFGSVSRSQPTAEVDAKPISFRHLDHTGSHKYWVTNGPADHDKDVYTALSDQDRAAHADNTLGSNSQQAAHQVLISQQEFLVTKADRS